MDARAECLRCGDLSQVMDLRSSLAVTTTIGYTGREVLDTSACWRTRPCSGAFGTAITIFGLLSCLWESDSSEDPSGPFDDIGDMASPGVATRPPTEVYL